MIKIDKNFFDKIIDAINFLVIIHTENEAKQFIKKINSFSLNEITTDFINLENKKKLEEKTIYEYIDENSFRKYYICSLGYNNIVVSLSRDMGSIKMRASNNTIVAAIDICKPKFIIMLGICAGVKDNIKIGDVIIADNIIGYDSKKITDIAVIDRYGRYTSSDLINLYDNMFIADYNNKHYYNLYFGNIVSSEALLNSVIKRNEVREILPEVLGYDMESIGLASSCNFKKVDNWIFIKGVSDSGTNKNDTYQTMAMNNAIEVSMNIFNNKFDKSTLKNNEYFIKRMSVFISGSFVDHDIDSTKEIINLTSKEKYDFIKKLSKKLINSDFKIISGCGEGFSRPLLTSIYETAMVKNKKISDCIETIIFPHNGEDLDKNFLDLMTANQRSSMISKAKISLFLFGTKTIEGESINADGVIKEFSLSLENGNYIIPIGIFGGSSKIIWEELSKDNNNIFKDQFRENYDEAIKILNYIHDYTNNSKKEINAYLDDLVEKIIDLILLLKY